MQTSHRIMENENKVWYLQHNRLFLDANFELVESCQHLFKMTLFPRRGMVFDQGDTTRLVYLVKRGKVRLARLTADGKEVTIAVLGAGDVFGEEALFEQATRTTVAICMEETLVCTSKADDLFALLTSDPTLALNVAKVLSDRLGDASATMEDLAYANVSDRIMHVFVRLAGEHGIETADGIALDVRLTHADIASLIGSTRETVSLEMADLMRSGRIRNDGHHITLPKAEIGTS
ncbi:MAG: Crp/Fnr family transcriptional regulator [Candidatus Eremiobacteraeota bacterium]|nr:Crp/Fnr family transcriptional regulator [Candidatus Eremiobacteraeota bacterium]MBC5802844.1 Crp/Fnr family transcriptional regulator [Candidatus Eremiobacteraeota bacterium]MBC5820796.1 Crp/Fnr family transcriptional regulator [Candidatus Eremiobacteraeota bacterium]